MITWRARNVKKGNEMKAMTIKKYICLALAGFMILSILGQFVWIEKGIIIKNTVSRVSAVSTGSAISAPEDCIAFTPSLIKTADDISKIQVIKIAFQREKDNDIQREMKKLYSVHISGKGGLSLAFASADSLDFSSLKVQLYADRALSEKVGEPYVLTSDMQGIQPVTIYFPQAGTYYLCLSYDGDTEGEQAKEKLFGMTAAFMYSTNRILEEKNSLVTYADKEQRAVYYKVVMKKDGLLSIHALPEDTEKLLTGKIVLCDAEKKALSIEEYVSGSKDSNHAVHAYYMVKRGTYYVRAKLNTSYMINCEQERVKDKAGSSLETASWLQWRGKEKTVAVYLEDGTNTEKWFRFRLDKRRNFSIEINSCLNGYLAAEVCNAYGTTVKSGATHIYTGKKILKTKSKWERGTYYVRLTKSKKSKKSSGYINIHVE